MQGFSQAHKPLLTHTHSLRCSLGCPEGRGPMERTREGVGSSRARGPWPPRWAPPPGCRPPSQALFPLPPLCPMHPDEITGDAICSPAFSLHTFPSTRMCFPPSPPADSSSSKQISLLQFYAVFLNICPVLAIRSPLLIPFHGVWDAFQHHNQDVVYGEPLLMSLCYVFPQVGT